MRIVVVLLLSCLLLVGCSESDSGSDPADDSIISPPPSVETSIGAGIPSDDPTLAHIDSAGRTPDEILLELIDAKNSSDWESAYSMYASPELDFESAANEWASAAEHYDGFTIREVRVISPGTAALRVTYEAETTPPGGDPYPITITEPGEWWGMSMANDQWKVNWLPRQ